MLRLLHSDKRFCQGFVFCNVSLSYLFPCFDFWSYVRRKTAKTVSPVSYKNCWAWETGRGGFHPWLEPVHQQKFPFCRLCFLYSNFSDLKERNWKNEDSPASLNNRYRNRCYKLTLEETSHTTTTRSCKAAHTPTNSPVLIVLLYVKQVPQVWMVSITTSYNL